MYLIIRYFNDINVLGFFLIFEVMFCNKLIFDLMCFKEGNYSIGL